MWTRYGAATSRIFAIYEPFRVGGGGFVVCSIFMNENGKMQTIHQPEALIKWGY
ncbi:TPA: ubiquitin--protein ligase [Escherichia coli]|nr:ubiquitin--protein ligase [Escherichia coli]EKY5035005.1 ubiquitin--protein ligase [Escherichia coli]HBQ4490845.1 ubiquitin--protein ligase [Escherichia coli]